jgi:hypothetical protein
MTAAGVPLLNGFATKSPGRAGRLFIRLHPFCRAPDASGTSGTSVNAAKLQSDVQDPRIDGCRRQALCLSGPFSHVRHISVAWNALGSMRNLGH